MAEYQHYASETRINTDRNGKTRNKTVTSDKSSIMNLARRLCRLTQILLRYKNLLVPAMPAYCFSLNSA